MFKLAERRGDGNGPYCGPEGLYLGPSPLIAKLGGAYRVRASDEIAALIEAAYGPSIEVSRLLPGLRLAAEALQRGEIARAMIATVRLRLGEIRQDRLARVAQLDSLLKFDPDEPRDWHGRWTTEGGEDGVSDDPGDGGNGGGSSAGRETNTRNDGDAGSSAEGAGRSGPPATSYERVWERFPNSDFRNQLAIAEKTADKPNFGYTEIYEGPDGKFALGRYQITLPDLVDVGMMDDNGKWTGKYGIYSRTQFLATPAVQEMVLTDVLNVTERQLHANGAFRYIGTTIDGLIDRFTVTRPGLIAAGHREGAKATRSYLGKLENSSFSSSGANLTSKDQAVETRLRTFAGARYE